MNISFSISYSHIYSQLTVNQLWWFWNACIINLNTDLKFSDLIGSLNKTIYKYDEYDEQVSLCLCVCCSGVCVCALHTCIFVLLYFCYEFHNRMCWYFNTWHVNQLSQNIHIECLYFSRRKINSYSNTRSLACSRTHCTFIHTQREKFISIYPHSSISMLDSNRNWYVIHFLFINK